MSPKRAFTVLVAVVTIVITAYIYLLLSSDNPFISIGNFPLPEVQKK